MGQFTFIVDDKLDAAFRRTVAVKLGMKKGNMVIALEQAMRNWIKENS